MKIDEELESVDSREGRDSSMNLGTDNSGALLILNQRQQKLYDQYESERGALSQQAKSELADNSFRSPGKKQATAGNPFSKFLKAPRSPRDADGEGTLNGDDEPNLLCIQDGNNDFGKW